MNNSERFQRLMQTREDKLYRIAFSYMTNKEDALDCVQDTMVKAIESIDRLDREEYFDTWVIRILINVCKDALRKRRNDRSFDETLDLSSTDSDQDEVIDLIRSLEKLSDEEREIIHRRYFEDRKIIEISQAMKLKESTVKSKIHRALGKLRKEL